MSNGTHRGTKNGRNTRNAARIRTAIERPTSRHATASRAFASWRNSDDARTASVRFNEFVSQRPDLNLDYLPESWVRWMTSRRMFVGNLNTSVTLDAPADETEQHEIDSVIAVIDSEAAFPGTVSLEDINAMQSAPSVLAICEQNSNELAAAMSDEVDPELARELPIKKTRKPRAKKTDAVTAA